MSEQIHILIADDNEFRRELIRRRLREIGLSPRCASIGPLGRRVVDEIARTEPHVLFLNINLPDLSGVMALAIIRHAHPEVSVIGYSSDENRYYLEHVEGVDVSGFVSPHPNTLELKSTIRAALSENEHLRSHHPQGCPPFLRTGEWENVEPDTALTEFSFIASAAA